MRPGTHAETPSVADVGHRAVAICDPDLLRLAARAEFGDDLPEAIALFLQDAGVSA